MRTPTQKRSSGFSLVEILVGMVMGLLGMIIIFQVFEVSEGIKRTSTSGGDAMQYGALALFTLERDLRMAGAGINSSALAGCKTHMYDSEANPKVRPPITLVPFVIDPNPLDKNLPDMLSITYGNSQSQSYPVEMTNTMTTPTSIIKVKQRYGFLPTNMVIIAQPKKDCWYAEITGLSDAAGETDQIQHGTAAYEDINKNSVTPRYNGPNGFTDEDGLVTLYEGGLGDESAKIYNVSSKPTRSIYSVDLNTRQLMLDSNRSGGLAPVVDNIVQLKAQYGHDNGVNDGSVDNTTYKAMDGMVDNYSASMPTSPAASDWLNVRSVRLAIVARSALPEKPSVDGGPCDTTTAAPTWAGGTLDLSNDPNWQCYRYRVFESIVPLRNAIWQQDKLN